MAATRPVPIPDERSAPFWEAARSHVLTISRCSRCRAFSFPPDITCPHCGSSEPDFAFEPVSGGAKVRSWTVVRQSFLQGFEVPYLLVDAELDVQSELRLIGRLLDGPDANLQLGDRLTIDFEDVNPEVSLYAFRLEDGS